jgi:hypothetical protein
MSAQIFAALAAAGVGYAAYRAIQMVSLEFAQFVEK